MTRRRLRCHTAFTVLTGRQAPLIPSASAPAALSRARCAENQENEKYDRTQCVVGDVVWRRRCIGITPSRGGGKGFSSIVPRHLRDVFRQKRCLGEAQNRSQRDARATTGDHASHRQRVIRYLPPHARWVLMCPRGGCGRGVIRHTDRQRLGRWHGNKSVLCLWICGGSRQDRGAIRRGSEPRTQVVFSLGKPSWAAQSTGF